MKIPDNKKWGSAQREAIEHAVKLGQPLAQARLAGVDYA
jgi:hypothetical protein